MIPGSANPLLLKSAAVAGPVQIERSLRFNSSDSGYCSRAAGSPTASGTWTFSVWVKRSKLGSDTAIFGGRSGGVATQVYFKSDNTIRWYEDTADFSTAAVFRDVSSWYHFVFAKNGSSSCTIYVNGVQLQQNTSSVPSTSPFNTSSAELFLGALGLLPSGVSFYGDHYLADIHFIDGQALTPSSFTEVSATTGQLVPKAYTGTFGTNGFWLKFSDNSAATAAALGNDYSGNNNDWTPNNLSVTAGSGNDSLVDTPTSYGTDTGVGNEVRGNYCTLSPLIATSGPISNGNLEMVGASAWRNTKGTISVSTGKWYFEATYSGSQYGSALGNLVAGVGFAKSNTSTPNVDVNDSSLYGSILAFSQTGHVNNFNAPTSARSQIANGDVIGFALNYDAGTYTIYVNNTSTSSGSLNFTGELTPWTNAYLSSSYFILNFGQRPFAYTAPSGFKALCDTNLTAPVIAKPNTVMDVKLYTGNGSTQTISGLGFSPDLIWIKSRSAAYDHQLGDTVRGVTNILHSNLTAAESTLNTITGTSSDGFTVSAASFIGTNANGQTFAAWTWDAGTSTVTNTQGTITSTVRANPGAGFSIVSFDAGTGGQVTMGHGLGVAPSLIIVKRRTVAENWYVWNTGFTVSEYLILNSTAAKTTSANLWGSTLPSSTLFGFNANSGTHIAYCFAPVAGYSSMGSYVGNGSNDGPFIYTGHSVRWLLLKNATTAADWYLFDSLRAADYNPHDKPLFPNGSYAEQVDSRPIDLLSNGFKIRFGTYNWFNGNGDTIIYCAFAQNPFQYARAR